MGKKCASSMLWIVLLSTFISSHSARCPPPPKIVDGDIYPEKEAYYYQDAVRYKCKDPSAVIEHGREYIYCKEDGTWSGAEPRCIVANCPTPHVPNSRKLSGFAGPYKLHFAVIFQCVDQRYRMEGSDTITCNINSEWEPQLPNCTRLYCPEPTIANGTVYSGKKPDGSYDINDSITLKCDRGYRIRGKSTLKCGRDFKWDNDFPVCEAALYCPEPKLLNGKVKAGRKLDGSYDINDSITLECEEKFKLNGKKKLYCTYNYQWSHEFPICELEKGCSSPRINNGRVIRKNASPYNPEVHGHGFSYGDTIFIECDDGYELHGEALSECFYWRKLTFYWETELPECRRMAS